MDAAKFLSYTIGDELAYMRSFGAVNVIGGTLMWAVIFAVTCLAVRRLIGEVGRWYWVCGAYCALSASCFSYIAADWRRLWLIAFVTQMGTTVMLARRQARSAPAAGGARPALPGGALAAVVVLTVVCGFYSGVFPVASFAGREYWKSDSTYWTPGHHRIACALGVSSSRC
jgi:hypothetical protein